MLIRGNSLLVLDLGLDIVNRIGGLDLKSDGLARKGLDEAIILSVPNFAILQSVAGGRFGRLTSAL